MTSARRRRFLTLDERVRPVVAGCTVQYCSCLRLRLLHSDEARRQRTDRVALLLRLRITIHTYMARTEEKKGAKKDDATATRTRDESKSNGVQLVMGSRAMTRE